MHADSTSSGKFSVRRTAKNSWPRSWTGKGRGVPASVMRSPFPTPKRTASMKSPTVSKLFGGDDYAVETVVPKDTINTLIPALKDAGATDIIELPLSKIVH